MVCNLSYPFWVYAAQVQVLARCVKGNEIGGAPLVDQALGPPGDGGDDNVAGAGGRGPPVSGVAGGRQDAAELAQHCQRILLRTMRAERLESLHLSAVRCIRQVTVRRAHVALNNDGQGVWRVAGNMAGWQEALVY